MRAPVSALERRTARPESDLLLALTWLRLLPEQVEACRQHLRDHRERFDWGFFIDQAGRHKVLPLIGHHIARHRLHHSGDGKPLIPHFDTYAAVYQGNRLRNEALGEEFGPVLDDLTASGIPYAVRKGPALAEGLYKDPGLRRMNDLDLLLRRDDVDGVGQVLRAHGYAQGHPTATGTVVEPFDRRTRAFWRLHVNNELPFHKPGNRLGVDVFAIDLCLDVFQHRPTSGSAVGDLLARRRSARLFGRQTFTLSLSDQMLDLCAHFHKEATARYYIEAGADLHLLKFLDIALMGDRVSRASGWEDVVRKAYEYQASSVVYFALQHVAWLYPTAVPKDRLAELRPDSTDLLDEYGALDGDTERWQLPFLERLFRTDRGGLVRGTSVIPHV
ncbi:MULTISPECIES: nucleotidyltransferase family protein [unclassified Streptomyces]|uniref:nucleotidyltransferase family protein n=1 Tax=unclassified Streptomyces TaxID=2593676 RepID=UPI002366F7E4|nr:MULTISPECIES: nucleotidyltransferase family protein [unclassified Streptomyces]MDF3139848.1 nucleotidyltransferase family protein [Streptomyces sp. T21Q-yed]WDF41906.1 nucleotidyltransferase family protein [Streptomyces sp. T12]